MAAKIQLRRDTAANWATSNPVLAQGEIGVITDTGDVKVGDGASRWIALSPFTPSEVKGASKLVSIGDNAFGSSLETPISTAGTSEVVFTVGIAATNISALWTHWYTQTATNPKTDAYPAGPITFSASLRIVSSNNPNTTVNQLYQFTFGGRTSVTLDPGGQIKADVLGLSLAVGDVVAVRTFLASGTAYSGAFVYGQWVPNNGGFTPTTDLTSPGSAAVTGSNGRYYSPSALLGMAESGRSAKSVLTLGDSIGFGIGDVTVFITHPTIASGGFILRAITGKAGMINDSISGDTAGFFQANSGSVKRLSVGSLCNAAIIEYGTNDLNSGSSLSSLKSTVLDLATKVRRLGITKVFLTTLGPRTSSTDGWATAANQTPLAMESDRVAYNTWLRAGCPIDQATKAPVAAGTVGALILGQFEHPVTGFFDTASTLETALNSGIWKPANRMATGSITSGSNILTSTDANFQAANMEAGGDLGTCIALAGAGVSGAILTQLGIGIVTNTTTAAVGGVAGTTVTNAALAIGVKTIDGVHPSSDGHYLMSTAIDLTQL